MKRRCASARASRGRPGVVGEHRPAELAAPSRAGELVALRARARVDDRRQRARLLAATAAMPRWPASFVAHGTTANERFGRSKPVAIAHRVAQPEARDDVVGDLRRRRRGRGDDRLRAEPARGVGEAEVVRAGSRAPTARRSAPRRRRTARSRAWRIRSRKPGRGEALRARRRAAARGPTTARSSAARLAAASCCALTSATVPGRDALERLDLVLHQRDERRDHEREVRAHERGQLVAERLARAGGHDDEHVAARRRRPRPPPAGPGGSRRSRTPRAAPLAGSVARANGVRRLGPEPGQRRGDERVGDERGAHGRTTIALAPVATGGFCPVVTKSAQSRHEFVAKRARSRHAAPSCCPDGADRPRPPRRASTPASGRVRAAHARARPSIWPRARGARCPTACRWPGWPGSTTTGRSSSPQARAAASPTSTATRTSTSTRPTSARPAASRPPAVLEAIAERAARGLQFLLPVEEALEAAELLAERYALPAWQFTLSASGANAGGDPARPPPHRPRA